MKKSDLYLRQLIREHIGALRHRRGARQLAERATPALMATRQLGEVFSMMGAGPSGPSGLAMMIGLAEMPDSMLDRELAEAAGARMQRGSECLERVMGNRNPRRMASDLLGVLNISMLTSAVASIMDAASSVGDAMSPAGFGPGDSPFEMPEVGQDPGRAIQEAVDLAGDLIAASLDEVACDMDMEMNAPVSAPPPPQPVDSRAPFRGERSLPGLNESRNQSSISLSVIEIPHSRELRRAQVILNQTGIDFAVGNGIIEVSSQDVDDARQALFNGRVRHR